MVSMATTQPTVQHVMDHWAAIVAHEAEHETTVARHIADHVARRDAKAAEAGRVTAMHGDE